MSLKSVELSVDVFTACLHHALATEKEEIMGLLIGEVNEQCTVVSIVASLTLRRSDKKSDRVEISEEQLVQAACHAEELANKFERPLRIVGWYHSHPHITVWPSHVDLRTQLMYQGMDPTFVGLIFAVYLTKQATKAHEIQVTCFQSTSAQSRREIPLNIVDPEAILFSTSLETLIQLPKILNDEETEMYERETNGTNGDFLIEQHNEAVHKIALGHIAEKITRPLLLSLVERNRNNKIRLQALQHYHKILKNKLKDVGLT